MKRSRPRASRQAATAREANETAELSCEPGSSSEEIESTRRLEERLDELKAQRTIQPEDGEGSWV